jgi:hypothetical protein
MTAAVIVQLVQEGKLGFDDLISKYLQGVPNGDKITIRQLIKPTLPRWLVPGSNGCSSKGHPSTEGASDVPSRPA